ncbi:MAG: hypothetical protein RBT01_00855 [Anaerolineaceae bacterium]|jgi:hypothetical protein|nr:hypothetical protein [Anaerolineaceae bacterium]
MELNRLDVLKKVELGEISLEEAAAILSELEEQQFSIQEKSEVVINPPLTDQQTRQSEKRDKPAWSIVFWIIPLVLGVLLTVFSANWFYQNYLISGLGYKFWLTWIPFLIGIFMIYIGWGLQRARWIHINIKQPKGQSPQRIFLAFPLPFQFAGFILKIFKGKLPKTASGANIEEIMSTLDQYLEKDEPLFVNVNDDDGTKVEIYIG